MNDAPARQQALDVSCSCIVQAPAGSGKTELLIQRLLALLAEVEEPKQILAITFTNKAAEEMRRRLLEALEGACHDEQPPEAHARLTRQLALRVLARHGDRLIRHPGQLAIQTIDSYNAALVKKMPWTSRLGGLPLVNSDPETLYQTAVDRLLRQLEKPSTTKSHLEILLRHLDNQVPLLKRLLVNMLEYRDQWLSLLVPGGETVKDHLETALRTYAGTALELLHGRFPSEHTQLLLSSARFAGSQLTTPGAALLSELTSLPEANDKGLEQWQALADLLLTNQGELRKTVNKRCGFPADQQYRQEKAAMLKLLDQLAGHPLFIAQLAEIRTLPAVRYSDNQWQLLDSLIALLPLLVAELWLVFRAQGEVDFAEIALKAIYSLGDAEHPSQLLLNIDQGLKHILIDEFQDTSRLQYFLLEHLLSGWTAGDGRTLFLVGDPMQSIYRFREAEVGLFLNSFKGSFGAAGYRLTPLRLSANFRSQQGLVQWFNHAFSLIFPSHADAGKGAVPFSQAESVKAGLKGEACRIYPFYGRNDAAEAQQILELVSHARLEDPHQTIAILVRSRNHLSAILPLLRRHGIAYQTQDVDLLAERPAALDLKHLTRALLHRGDRLSWIAVLRAPWCGLTLADLSQLPPLSATTSIYSWLCDETSLQQLSPDGYKRLSRVGEIFQQACKRRGQVSLRSLVEGCWLALGAPACYAEDELVDAGRVFDLLEDLDEGGDLSCFEQLDRGLARLFAVSAAGTDVLLQIMTIHKAKGLEFDTVILPGLGRPPRRSEAPLLRWLDHPEHGLLMAPVAESGGREKDHLYQLLGRLEREKDDLESVRLLYVAATRAARRLHLLGHVQCNSDGQYKPQSGSLLEKLWPAVEAHYQSDHDQQLRLAESRPAQPLLTRLPAQLSLPQLAHTPGPLSSAHGATGSCLKQEPGEVSFRGWEDPAARHIGTAVHLQLERIAGQGFSYWSEERRKPDIRSFLAAAGIAESLLEQATEKVCRAVGVCLGSSRGRWVLEPHPGAGCELPLSGVVDGVVVHAVIDRTFIDAGRRWIIDYKSSSPAIGESLKVFLGREARRYKEQLRTYARLFSAMDEPYPVSIALYFPLINGWYEYPQPQ